MNTPGVDPKLQKIIRKELEEKEFNWDGLAILLGTSLKSVQYNLNADLGRPVTFHFIGMLAVNFPVTWKKIMMKYSQKRTTK